jgi:hypothetical protein
VSLKHKAAQATLATAAGLGALLMSSAVAAAEPPPPVPAPAPEPGVEHQAAPEEQPREEKQEPCKGDWCEILNAAKQLPAPNWDSVDYPKLAEVSVPVQFSVPMPDVVPDLPDLMIVPALPDINLGLGGAVGAASAASAAASAMPSLPAPKLQLPPPPKPKLPMPKFDLTKLGQFPF